MAAFYYVGWFCWDIIPLVLIMNYQVKKVKKRENGRTTRISTEIALLAR